MFEVETTQEEFKAVLEWFMCSDPWPTTKKNYIMVKKLLNRVAEEFGYTDWVDALHGLRGKEQNDGRIL